MFSVDKVNDLQAAMKRPIKAQKMLHAFKNIPSAIAGRK